MSEFVRYDVRDRTAVVTIDNPPVNALAEGVREAIESAVFRASESPHVDAIVIIGAGSTFIAGADIRVFDSLTTVKSSVARSIRVHALLSRLEDTPKPLVAAIHGNAFGGGLELAMACHYRVATPNATMGQPEVTLGLMPGAGGTQRLPRLVGANLALAMSTDGKPIPSSLALTSGLIDAIVPGDLLEGAIAFARARAAEGARRKTRDIVITAEGALAGREASIAARDSFTGPRHLAAPLRAIEAIDAAFTLPFEQGSARERELFADCVVSTESRALRHLFFAEREAAKIPDVSRDTPLLPIARAAVLGAGTMGGGIAMCYANAGIPVVLTDVDETALARGLATIRTNYQASIAKGRLTESQAERLLSLITPTTDLAGCAGADIVVEAVFEDLDLKREMFAAVARAVSPDCVLASNTSTLDIDDMAEASGRPDRVVGHHFFSPANVMKLLEVVRGRATSPSVIATSVSLAKRLGKVPVVVGNCFGFVANRMLAYYMREAYLLLEEGANVEQIDRVVMDFGLPVGPFGMQDIAGIDVGARIRQHLARLGKTRADGPQSEVPDRLFEMGRYGQKTGAGWYRYEAGSRRRIADPIVDELAAQAAARRGVTRRRIDDDEVLARLTTALANEGARILEEGHALRAGDIDVVYCHGFGFPRFRGGPLFYADTVGLPAVLARVREYRERFGDYWRPSRLLEEYVDRGRGFHEPRAIAAGRRSMAPTGSLESPAHRLET
jgi:3-hydroxyacyl-CoA dehydrogenase